LCIFRKITGVISSDAMLVTDVAIQACADVGSGAIGAGRGGLWDSPDVRCSDTLRL
jgi:hypothetical protein